MKSITLLCVLILSVWVPTSKASLILDVVNGQLIGAKNVVVDGELYDVQFVDSNCALAHGTCSNIDFAFKNEQSAYKATLALIAQVLLDTSEGLFATDLSKIFGAPDSKHSLIMTAYETNPHASFTVLAEVVYAQAFVDCCGYQADYMAVRSTVKGLYDWGNESKRVFAVWSAIEVSSPTTFILLSLGIAGLSFSRYRRQF
jgi:hypothetical protein